MAYSRWSNSRWYTYWSAMSEPENHNNATFMVDDLSVPMSFQAAEIRKDVDSCVRRAMEQQGGSDEDARELRGYMLAFLRDVDAKHPRKQR